MNSSKGKQIGVGKLHGKRLLAALRANAAKMLSVRWDEWRGSLDDRPTMLIRHLVDVRGMRVDLHKFVDTDDEGCFHTHPSTAFRLVLGGGYIEEMEDGTLREWRPLRAGFVAPQLSHRISKLRNGRWSYSVWVRGPKRCQIELRGDGWPESIRHSAGSEQ